MTLPPNVEKSAFHDGYAAWDGFGQPWRVTRHHRNRAIWVARPAPNHTSRWLPAVQGRSLAEIGDALAARRPQFENSYGEPF